MGGLSPCFEAERTKVRAVRKKSFFIFAQIIRNHSRQFSSIHAL